MEWKSGSQRHCDIFFFLNYFFNYQESSQHFTGRNYLSRAYREGIGPCHSSRKVPIEILRKK